MSLLEKRIKQKSFKHTWHTQHMNFLKDEILLDNMFTIIDEMCQDYPTLKKIMKRYCVTISSIHYPLVEKDMLTDLKNEREKWFTKWFGESK